MSWTERDERVAAATRRYLAGYITRDVDRAALAGTPWAVPEPAGDTAPPAAMEVEHAE